MTPKGAVFRRVYARLVGFWVAPTFRVAPTLSQGCSAALDPADSDGLRFPAFSAPGFSVDDDAAGHVVRSR